MVGIYISSHPLDDFNLAMDHFVSISLNHLSNLENHINRELTVGGIVNEVEHLESRAGKSWARFTLEDFTDIYEFRIFGEDYLKFRHFLVSNQFIRIRLMIREGWINKESGRIGSPRIQYLNFEMLEKTIENNAKKITLNIDVKHLKIEKIDALKDYLKSYKGDKPLYFNLYDSEKKVKLTMNSRKQKVKITPEFLNELRGQEWVYTLN